MKKPIKLVEENTKITIGCENPISERKVPSERTSLTEHLGNIQQ